MDVAAFRRLQHRMESRGRAASSCRHGHSLCSCAPPPPRGESAGMATLDPAAQAWLLHRVQGVEVDITDGGTSHRRPQSCCCSCCQGYHHLFHTSKRDAAEAEAPGTSARRLSPVREAATEEHPLARPGEGTVRGTSSPVRGVQSTQYGTAFSPAKASLMLSSFLHRAESLSPQLPSASRSASRADDSHRQQQRGLTMADEYGGVSRLSFDLRRTHELPSVPCPIITSAQPAMQSTLLSQFDTSAQQQQQQQRQEPQPSLSAVATPAQPQQQQQPQQASEVPQSAVVATEGAADVQRPHTTAVAVEAAMQTTSLLDTPPVTSANGAPPLGASGSVSASAGAAGPQQLPVQQSGVSMTSAVSPAAAASVAVPTAQPSNISPALAPPTVQSAEVGTSTTATAAPGASTATGGGPSAEPTPADVINALREKLLLEKADAYVRGLEQRQQEEERLSREQEEQLRSHQEDEIVSLLFRLRQDDHEMLEAMFDTITQRDENEAPPPLPPPPATQDTAPPFPAGVMAAYTMGIEKAAQPLSQPKQEPPMQPEHQQQQPPPPSFTVPPLPQAAPAPVAPAPPPLPPLPTFTVPPLPQAVPAPVAQAPAAPAPLPPPSSTSRAVPWDSTSVTMKAWVDEHFGSTLDPQHRALLQHVLLSREAEVRRGAAAESQCKELEARLSAAKASGPQTAGDGTVRPDFSQLQQQQRESELTKALTLLHAKEEELKAVRKMQQEQERKVAELTQSLLPQPLRRPGAGGLEEENEELRRWKVRCETTEQQHRFSVQRLAELQAYIEQLRSGAQQAVRDVVSSNAAAHTVPIDATTVRLSSLSGSRPTCCWEGATPHSSVSGARFLPEGNGPSQQLPPPLSPPLRQHVTASNTPVAAVPSQGPLTGLPEAARHPLASLAPAAGDSAYRAEALRQLREELETECGRFADESQRWHQYVRNQEERWTQLHQR
ncbi:hypothetical protein DQ04_00451120 [Trypanosoma grayi]|uniref:hypothetical protein n=1 Tax=Trypanosoma grayi TaxID=71804 RepID=UPI0004F4A972|nr:hypothetical protein DQ04_00451120 [Trypanosoma grayi]KEG14473.1 hypothetical protein DQ04_00451120 [Trypanosoma grayi]